MHLTWLLEETPVSTSSVALERRGFVMIDFTIYIGPFRIAYRFAPGGFSRLCVSSQSVGGQLPVPSTENCGRDCTGDVVRCNLTELALLIDRERLLTGHTNRIGQEDVHAHTRARIQR